MTASRPDMAQAREARMVGLVMAVTIVAWVGLQVMGSEMGWPARYALLADLAALAGFVWCLVATYRIWRKRRA